MLADSPTKATLRIVIHRSKDPHFTSQRIPATNCTNVYSISISRVPITAPRGDVKIFTVATYLCLCYASCYAVSLARHVHELMACQGRQSASRYLHASLLYIGYMTGGHLVCVARPLF